MTSYTNPLPLAQDLIRRPSITPHDEGALDVLQQALEALGFTCHRLVFSEEGTPDVDNLYARLGSEAPNFCFAGHTDVVPVGRGWTREPFNGDIIDGQLIGRGAADMKGAIAAFVAGVARLLETGKPKGSISFLITGDEEGPAINGTKKVLDWLAERGETLDMCLVGEPTNPLRLGEMMKIGRRGSLNGYLSVYGVGGHVAYPHLAENPIPRMMTMLQSLIAEPLDEGTEHFQPSSLVITTIDVDNHATNVIPGEARSHFNIRFNDLHTHDSLEAMIRAKLDAVGGEYELRVERPGEAFLTPPGALSQTIADVVERVIGSRPKMSTSGGTSDARFIKDYCPVVEFGLIGQTMHKADERVNVSDIEALAEIYHQILTEFLGA